MSWTDERVELLRKLWQDGLSASQIAGELGNGITRNAVIGKVHRLGMSGRVKPPNAATARPRAPKPTRPAGTLPMRPLMTRGNTALATATLTAEMPRPRSAEHVVVPLSEPVTITDLREHMCRWPIGDPTSPEFRFCGARSSDGPYCAGHSRMAYQPVQDRRRDRGLARLA